MNSEINGEAKIEIMQFVSNEQLNSMGRMHGGEILKLMDNTCGLAFTRYSRGNAVTAAANDISFLKPIPAGCMVKCIVEIKKVGRTSIETYAEVYVEEIVTGNTYKAATGTFIGVAIDEEGKPRCARP